MQPQYGTQRPQLNVPVTPYEVLGRPAQWDLDSPPALPQGIETVPQLQHSIIPVAALVANEISRTVNLHAGRVFLFNMCSMNNWNNPNYVFVINTALNMLMMGMFNRNFQSPEQGGRQCVEQAVGLASALNFQMYQDLFKIVPPNVHPDIGQNINRYPALMQDFANIRQYFMQAMSQGGGIPQIQQQQQYGGSGMGPGMAPNAYGNVTAGTSWNQGHAAHRANFGPVAGQGYFPMQGQVPNMQGNSGVQGLFTNNGQKAGHLPEGATLMASGGARFADYSNKVQSSTIEPAVDMSRSFNHRAPVIAAAAQVIDVPVKVVVQKPWVPSKAQQYKPAYNSLTQKLELGTVVWADGEELPVYTVVDLTKEEMMQRQAHEIGSVDRSLTGGEAGTPVRQEILRNTVDEAVRRGTEVRQFESEVGKVPVSERPPQYRLNTPEGMFIDLCFDNVLFQGRLWRRQDAVPVEGAVSAIVCKGLIGRPQLTDEDYTGLLQELSEIDRFDFAANWIRNNLRNPSTAELAAEIDKVLTRAVNSILHNQLSVALSITSFMDDAVPLMAHLDKELGPAYKNAYRSCQEHLTSAHADGGLLKQELVFNELFAKTGITKESGTAVTFIPKVFQFILLGVRSAELGITLEADKDIPSITLAQQLTESENYSLYMLAKEMFARIEADQDTFAHCLLVTDDNEIYEFHKGLIGIDCFTINKYVP